MKVLLKLKKLMTTTLKDALQHGFKSIPGKELVQKSDFRVAIKKLKWMMGYLEILKEVASC